MADKQSTRREEILLAARKEFIQHGLSGARMKAIAQKTGVTKAMIHYYFETKENLFREAFRESCKLLMDGLMPALESEGRLFKKVETFIDQLLNRFQKRRDLISFVTNELNQHADITEPIFRESCDYDAAIFRRQLAEAASNYEIAPVKADQLIANIISLCMFPYSSRGLLQTLLGIEEADYSDKFLRSRRELIKDTIINGLAG